jgi:hypothetical protein
MTIQERATNSKGHTLGFRVSGKWQTRDQTVLLVKAGKIPNVTVRRSTHGDYVAALPDRQRLYDLPERNISTIRSRVFAS